jgi:isoprenylcysteine carboxyl methyltransferase (ICMT) family protein YpbQ
MNPFSGLVLYEGLGLALAVFAAVTVVVGIVAVAGVLINRVAAHYDVAGDQ